jgi:hypothetical protein
MNAASVMREFADVMCEFGLVPPNELIANGRLHGCRTEGVHRIKRASVPS